ncbi:metal-dependent hydrolase [Rhodococcus ruber BKS 20-38]|uniref:Metal-dependent hydrolase n=1 Tax=Rhodococcus ruber BKS 20-38 TaxID=1278076 RepID=M2XU05_9NOCA|nr:metal-dependent hydrolase [Rhodococcus ruber]EME64451.1 metal-dependent hydrolase [Rhodococcus ruber BKS 20-38]
MSASLTEPDRVLLQARDVEFDWSALPLHWVPGDPFSTHVLNVLHLLLPAGEEWFVETFREALPLIRDEQLREDVVGFIGQESVHADAHRRVLEQLEAKGLDPTPFTDQMRWLFGRLLGRRPLTGLRAENYLVERLAIIAAVEHVTAFLGDWVLNAKGLDAAGTDPTMLDLLRWHGAEEVEHRSVAYDVMRYFDPGEARRIRTQLLVAPVLLWLWIRGARFLMAHDPVLAAAPGHARAPHLSDWSAASRRGTMPGPVDLGRRMSRYFRRSYHPSQEGSTAQAVRYLASSPAARAAAR